MKKKKKTADSDYLQNKTLFSSKPPKEEDKVVLNMTFQEAMKKALNTPLPKIKSNKKN